MRLEDFYFKMPPLKTDPVIDDTTLRDGAQMAGVAFKPKDAAQTAQLLTEVGAERIELFHYQEPDKEAARQIMNLKLDCRLSAWCRALKADVDNAIDLGFEEVGISHPVSFLHLQAKWPNKTPDELLANVIDVVEYAAKTCGLRTFVHGEDGTRADWSFEKQFVNAVADAGAECYRVCDTVGIGLADPAAPLPFGVPRKIRLLKEETKIPSLGIHMHDDFGNAVGNSLAAVQAASGLWDKLYINTTFLGIGERAGNAETEKILLNLYLHYGVRKFEGKTEKLSAAADLISKAVGIQVPPNKAIVGKFGFMHESGIHTYAVLSNPWTYEPYPPELVGNTRHLSVGKQSGKTIIKHKLFELTGTDPDTETVAAVLIKIKDIYATGRSTSIDDQELKKILEDLKQPDVSCSCPCQIRS